MVGESGDFWPFLRSNLLTYERLFGSLFLC
jgi:hypothetical protein